MWGKGHQVQSCQGQQIGQGRCSVDLSYPVRFCFLPLKQWVVKFNNEKYYPLNYVLLMYTPTTTLNLPLE